MNTECGVPGLPAASSSASSPVQLALEALEQQSFTGWQGQAESFLTARSVPVIARWDNSPLKLHESS